MQFVLKSIYSGPFLDFVVRNDLVGVRGGGLDETWGVIAQKGKIRGKGIDNDRVSLVRMSESDQLVETSSCVSSSGPL